MSVNGMNGNHGADAIQHPTALQDPKTRGLAGAAAVLCLLGIAVSIELTRIHVLVHLDPNYHSACAVSEGVNCETVAVSPYSVFMGLPVSVWGLLGYLAMGVLALWAWSQRRLHATWPWGTLVVLTAFSVLVSLALAFISVTTIDSVCLFCMASYAINIALLVLCILAVKRLHQGPLHLVVLDVKALLARPLLAVPLGVAALTGVAALLALVPAYWQTPGWKELPKLHSGTDNEGHHWMGALHPTLTIVEFSDYECPHCRSAHKTMRLLAAKHPDRVRLVHRQLPLDMACHPLLQRPFHAHACLFAEAAECAGLQGRFWEMNDALFSIQDTVKSKNVDPFQLAVRLGLDRNTFKQCMEQHLSAERVSRDIKASMELKLTGTPSFLVDGRIFVGRIPEEDLERMLAEGSTADSGTR